MKEKTILKNLIKELDEAYQIAKSKELSKEMANITLAKAKLLGIFEKTTDTEPLKQELIKFI